MPWCFWFTYKALLLCCLPPSQSVSQSDQRTSSREQSRQVTQTFLNEFIFLRTCWGMLRQSKVTFTCKHACKFSSKNIPALKICLAKTLGPRFFQPGVNARIARCIATTTVKRNLCFQSVWWAELLDSKQQHPHETDYWGHSMSDLMQPRSLGTVWSSLAGGVTSDRHIGIIILS